MTPTTPDDNSIRGTTALLDDVLSQLQAQHGSDAKISIGELVDALKARAYGVILLLMALPCCLPFIYILPQIMAFPMLFLTWQLASGRTTVWLPENLRKRRFGISLLATTVSKARPWLERFEFFAGPRIAAATEGNGLRLIGALLMIPCASILVPLPLTNSVPGLGVAIAAIGLIERDGLLTIIGLIVGLIWVAALLIGGGALLSFLISFLSETVSGV